VPSMPAETPISEDGAGLVAELRVTQSDGSVFADRNGVTIAVVRLHHAVTYYEPNREPCTKAPFDFAVNQNTAGPTADPMASEETTNRYSERGGVLPSEPGGCL